MKENDFDKALKALQIATLNACFTSDSGLFRGKMGFVVYFSHYVLNTGYTVYEKLIDRLLDDIYSNLNRSIPINIETGLCGIGWGIEYLIHKGFVKGNTDELLEEVDFQIMERNPLYVKDYSFRTGLGGILYYVMIRLSSPRDTQRLPFEDSYLQNLRGIAEVHNKKKDSFACLCKNFIDVLDGKKKIFPDLADLFSYESNHLDNGLPLGMEKCWETVEYLIPPVTLQTENDKNYYLITESSNSLAYGVGTFIRQTSIGLNQIGWDVTVVVLRSSNTQGISVETKDGIRYIHIGDSITIQKGLKFKDYLEKYYLNILALLSTFIPDKTSSVFHLNNMHMADLAMHLKHHYTKTKIVSTVHYMDWSFELWGNENLLKSIEQDATDERHLRITTLLKENIRFLNTCDLIHVSTWHTYQFLTGSCGLPASKIVHIPIGIEDKSTLYKKDNKANLKNKYGFATDDYLLLYAGRIESIKGVDLLIEAFPTLLAKHPHIRLIIVGQGEVKTMQRTAMPHLGKIIFTGHLDQKSLYDLYHIADLGIVPSVFEEYGLVAIEMMMMGLPVVVGNNSGLEEIVNGGEAGIVIPFVQEKTQKEFNINSLKETLLKALADETLLHKNKNAALSRYKRHYQINGFIRELNKTIINY